MYTNQKEVVSECDSGCVVTVGEPRVCQSRLFTRSTDASNCDFLISFAALNTNMRLLIFSSPLALKDVRSAASSRRVCRLLSARAFSEPRNELEVEEEPPPLAGDTTGVETGGDASDTCFSGVPTGVESISRGDFSFVGVELVEPEEKRAANLPDRPRGFEALMRRGRLDER